MGTKKKKRDRRRKEEEKGKEKKIDEEDRTNQNGIFILKIISKYLPVG